MEGSAVLATLARNLVGERNARCENSLISFKPEFAENNILQKTTAQNKLLFHGVKLLEFAIYNTTNETDMTEEHEQMYGRRRGVIENDVFYVLFMFDKGKYALFAFQDSNHRDYYR